jgi:molybdopterin-containing oxidoreductase family molybdopterin binding subunit
MKQAVETGHMQDDVWIPSVCAVCFNQCSIRVHRVNGVVVKIEGNPDSPVGMGRLCAKGMSGIPLLYDPSRITTPLRRTNPKKDFTEDPGWVPISWDEALDILTEKLKAIRAEEPRKLLGTATVLGLGGTSYWFNNLFMSAFGSPNTFTSDGHQCGNAEHILVGQMHGAVTAMPDFEFCNYLLVMGAGVGGHAYYAFTSLAQKMADARSRGMKLVVVDPVRNGVAEKADEWVPIRPGTDGAMAMAMLNVILNELQRFDAEYLQEHTNAIYLVGRDGNYVRDAESDKPLVWDQADDRAKVYDDPSLRDPALEGCFQVDGRESRPAFVLLRQRVAQFTPEEAERITSVPAATIRRIATEFAQEARIGSTIVLEGKTLPYRPVCLIYFKGAHAHNHAWLTCMAFELLCEVVGACDVPGGLMGTNPVANGYPETGLPRWAPFESLDGLLSPGVWGGATEPGLRAGVPYPPRQPRAPEQINLADLLCTGMSGHPSVMVLEDTDKFKIPYKPEMLFLYGTNLVYSLGNPETTANALKQLFVVAVKLWLDETTAFADLVLPDTCYLERLEPVPNNLVHHFPVGRGDWAHAIRQPVVPPPGECRPFMQVMLELADRLGFLPDMHSGLNHFYGLKPPYALELDRRYTIEEIADRIYKCWFGPDHGLEYMKTHGVITWPKQIEEVYWKAFRHLRVPIYFEHVKKAGEKIRAVLDDLGINDIDTSDYDALPDWKPCAALEARDQEYDLQAVYSRAAHHQFSYTFQNPWLAEISAMDPYTNYVSINVETARRKGIRDGDQIWIKAKGAGSTLGVAKLVQGIHPEVVGIINNGGHWAKGMPVAQGKGTFFEPLMTTDWAHTDPVVIAIDADAAVKIEKAGAEAGDHATRWGRKHEE